MRRTLVLLLVIVAALCRNVRADTVTLNSGEVLQGRIVSETDAVIRLETTNETLTIWQTDIRAVQHGAAVPAMDKAAKVAVAPQSQAPALMAEGDSLLQAKQYKAAAGKYLEALTARPLLPETVEALVGKGGSVGQQWRDVISAAQAATAVGLLRCDAKAQPLIKQRDELKERIAANKSEDDLIKRAVVEKKNGHWVVYQGENIIRDFGPVLPPPTHVGDYYVAGSTLKTVEAALAANETEKKRLIVERAALTAQLEENLTFAGQLATAVAQAKAEQPPPENPAVNDTGVSGSERALDDAGTLFARGDCRGAILKAKIFIGAGHPEIDQVRRATELIDRAYDRWLHSLKEQEGQHNSAIEAARREVSKASDAADSAGKKLAVVPTAANASEPRPGQQAALFAAQKEQNDALAQRRAAQGQITQLTATLAPLRYQIGQVSADRNEAQQQAARLVQALEQQAASRRTEEERRRAEAETRKNAPPPPTLPPPAPTWWDKYWIWVAVGGGLALI